MNNNVWAALYSRLAGGTALTLQIGGTAAPRIYHGQAPEASPLPYLIFSWAGGGLTPTTPHTDGEGPIYLRAYSSVSAKEAGNISAAAFALLDRQPLTITGWNNSWLACESPHIEFPSTDESGQTIWTCGDHYRIKIDKT